MQTPTKAAALEVHSVAARWSTPSWMRALAGVLSMFAPVYLLVLLFQPLPGLAVLAALGLFISVALRRRRLFGSLDLDDKGLSVTTARGRNRIRHDDVVSGFDDPIKRATVLDLANGSRVELEIADDAARALVLQHLGHTLDRRALTAPLRGMLGSFTRGVVAFSASSVVAVMALAFAGQPLLFAPLIATVGTVLCVKRFGTPRVVVGAEGVRLVGRLIPRFIPFSTMDGVTASTPMPDGTRGIELLLDGGRKVFLPTVGQSKAQIDALVRRISDGRRRFDTAETTSLQHFERAGRTISAWREDLSRQVRGGGFRQAVVTQRDLEALVDDPAAPIDRRVGAALALRELAPDGAVRIRVAAERAADDHVRVALDVAASDELDEERLDQILGRAARSRSISGDR